MKTLVHRMEQVDGLDRHVIELPGEFGADESLDEFARLTKGILAQPESRIRVDCRDVQQLSANAVSVLMAACSRAERTRSVVKVDIRSNPRLLRLFGSKALFGDDDGLAGNPSRLEPPPKPKPGGRARSRPAPGNEPQA
jgi:anti-anti-sigma regulatory factor